MFTAEEDELIKSMQLTEAEMDHIRAARTAGTVKSIPEHLGDFFREGEEPPAPAVERAQADKIYYRNKEEKRAEHARESLAKIRETIEKTKIRL